MDDHGFLRFPEVDIKIPFTSAALIQAKLTPRAALDAMSTGYRYGGQEALSIGRVGSRVNTEPPQNHRVRYAKSVHSDSWTRPALASARTIWAAVTLLAIVVTWVETASRGPVNLFNFFGYFTLQSNSLLVIAAFTAGIAGFLRPGPQSRWIVVLRSLTTVCMVIVGIVYATLLAPLGLEGGAPVPWANWVMHYGGPILVAIDWIFTRDREPLTWQIALMQLIYPIAWVTVVLARGATDGWVPYPFLNPSQGYVVISFYVAIIAVTFLLVSILVVWWSRRRFWVGALPA